RVISFTMAVSSTRRVCTRLDCRSSGVASRRSFTAPRTTRATLSIIWLDIWRSATRRACELPDDSQVLCLLFAFAEMDALRCRNQGLDERRIEEIRGLEVGERGDEIVACRKIAEREAAVRVRPRELHAPRQRTPGRPIRREDHDE